MLTAYKMRELNIQLKISLSEKSAKEIALEQFSKDVMRALKYVSDAVQERTSTGFPYRDNSLTFNVSTALGRQDHYPELITVLRNLGYSATPSHSTSWGNEQLTISW